MRLDEIAQAAQRFCRVVERLLVEVGELAIP
jgi:hypothetical protein